jgi:hypothetical protein
MFPLSSRFVLRSTVASSLSSLDSESEEELELELEPSDELSDATPVFDFKLTLSATVAISGSCNFKQKMKNNGMRQGNLHRMRNLLLMPCTCITAI